MTNISRLTWRCGLCQDVVVSRSDRRWDMNFCKCGKTGVDLESWYQRNSGFPVVVKEEILDEQTNTWSELK